MLHPCPCIDLPPAAGVLDQIRLQAGELTVWGWTLSPDARRQRVRILVDGQDLGFAENIPRPDVKTEYGWIPHAEESGFRFQREWGHSDGRIDLIGENNGVDVFRFSSFFVSDLENRVPTPPQKLTDRVAGVGSRAFKIQGLKIFTDFWDQIAKSQRPQDCRLLLDWGCGCGRVTAHFIAHFSGEVVGADLDAEAISWCLQNLSGAGFDVVGSQPPLPYAESSFDVVTACSVFTHLSRRDQEVWLEEMARVLKPGGVLLATTHGQFAYRQQLFCRQRKRPFWSRLPWLGAKPILSGFVDSGADPALAGVAPEDYYRTVYQSRSYTLKAWSNWFEILDYIERGVNGFQDLAVMRNPT